MIVKEWEKEDGKSYYKRDNVFKQTMPEFRKGERLKRMEEDRKKWREKISLDKVF